MQLLLCAASALGMPCTWPTKVARSCRRSAHTGLLAIAVMCVSAAPAYAVNASAFLTGTVTSKGRPMAHITVTASGNNLTVRTTTDAKGRFSFPPLALGTYDVESLFHGKPR
jgi:Carboxypeptidase regulatory-like domain